MNTDPWIPVEEMLPQPFQAVFVWTDYSPQPYFAEDLGPEGPRRCNYSFTLMTGYMDNEDVWHLPILGDLRLYNHRALSSEKGQDLGLFQPIDVLFWMLMPPAPPGQKYPKLHRNIVPLTLTPEGSK